MALAVDLAPLLAVLLAIALLYAGQALVKAIHDFANGLSINLGITTWHPLGFVVDLANTVLGYFHSAINDLEGTAQNLFSGMLDSFKKWGALFALGPALLYTTINRLWHDAIPARIAADVAPVRNTANNANDKATKALAAATAAEAAARLYADGKSSKATADANAYTNAQVKALHTTVTGQIKTATDTTIPNLIAKDLTKSGPIGKAIANAVANAPYLTQTEVAKIITEDLGANGNITKAIAHAINTSGSVTAAQVRSTIADELKAGGSIYKEIEKQIAALPHTGGVTATQVTQAINASITADLAPGGPIAKAIDKAIRDAITPAPAIPAPGTTPVTTPIPIPVPAPIPIPTPSLGDITAAVGVLSTAVAAIEAISFIQPGPCRDNVNQLCGVDGSALAGLLGGLAALGIGFSLEELAKLAAPMIEELEPLIRQAA